jgi:hypothetical protein
LEQAQVFDYYGEENGETGPKQLRGNVRQRSWGAK